MPRPPDGLRWQCHCNTPRMLLFRRSAIGPPAACLWILATRPVAIVVRPEPQPMPRTVMFEVSNLSGIRGVPMSDPDTYAAPTIIDIAPNISATQLPALIHLGEGEHVVAVNDAPAVTDLDAGRLLAATTVYPQRYVD